jgi:hypothetical protein
MNRTMRSSLFLLPVAFVLAFVPAVAARMQDATKTVYATWLDADAKPITDLGPDEIAVFEDGKFQRPIVSMKKADDPISIILLADSSAATGNDGFSAGKNSAGAAGNMMNDIHAAFDAFAKQMLAANPKNEVALMEFGQASIMMVPFTSNSDDISKGLTHLVSKPNAASVLLEAISESAKELGKRPNARRAIVAINILPDNEQSREPANNIMKEMAKDRAAFFSVSLQKGDLKNSVRGPVLEGFSDKTGGRRDVIVGQSALINVLKGYGDILNAQYQIQFTRPAGPMPQAFQLATAPTRGKVKILHSKFPPQ